MKKLYCDVYIEIVKREDGCVMSFLPLESLEGKSPAAICQNCKNAQVI